MVYNTKTFKYSRMLNYSRILIAQAYCHPVVILSLYIYIGAQMHIYMYPLPPANHLVFLHFKRKVPKVQASILHKLNKILCLCGKRNED